MSMFYLTICKLMRISIMIDTISLELFIVHINAPLLKTGFSNWVGVSQYILKAIKNATGISVFFPINISLIHFAFVLSSVPNVGERFTKT